MRKLSIKRKHKTNKKKTHKHKRPLFGGTDSNICSICEKEVILEVPTKGDFMTIMNLPVKLENTLHLDLNYVFL